MPLNLKMDKKTIFVIAIFLVLLVILINFIKINNQSFYFYAVDEKEMYLGSLSLIQNNNLCLSAEINDILKNKIVYYPDIERQFGIECTLNSIQPKYAVGNYLITSGLIVISKYLFFFLGFIFITFSLLFVYLISRKFLPAKDSLILTILIGISPPILMFGNLSFMNPVGLLFFLMFVYSFFNYQDQKSKRYLFIEFLSILLVMLTRPEYILIIPFFLVFQLKNIKTQNHLKFFILFLLFIIFMFTLINYHFTNDIIKSPLSSKNIAPLDSMKEIFFSSIIRNINPTNYVINFKNYILNILSPLMIILLIFGIFYAINKKKKLLLLLLPPIILFLYLFGHSDFWGFNFIWLMSSYVRYLLSGYVCLMIIAYIGLKNYFPKRIIVPILSFLIIFFIITSLYLNLGLVSTSNDLLKFRELNKELLSIKEDNKIFLAADHYLIQRLISPMEVIYPSCLRCEDENIPLESCLSKSECDNLVKDALLSYKNAGIYYIRSIDKDRVNYLEVLKDNFSGELIYKDNQIELYKLNSNVTKIKR